MFKNKRIKKLKRDFWEYPKYPFVTDELIKYYSENYDRLIKNSNTIIDNNSKECAIFWSELIRSDFIIKFINDVQTIFNPKKEINDVQQAIKIIKNTYENSYQYFAFFTIANIGSTEELYEFWYKPYRAKESANANDKNPWQIDKNKVSGKFWVINNCPLLKLTSYDIKLLRKIRDSESHETIVITEDKVFILDGKKTIELDNQTVIKLAEFLKGCINIIFHFYMSLLIREKFWIFLTLFIVREKQYSQNNTPFHILQTKQKDDKKEKIDLDGLTNSTFCSIVQICFGYSMYQIWKDLRDEVDRLNIRFNQMGLKVNELIILELQQGAICDFYNTIALFNYKTKQLYLNIEADLKEIEIKDLDNVDFRQLLKDTQETYRKVLRLKSEKENAWLVLSMILGGALIIGLPINRFIRNLDNLLIQAE